MQARSARGKEKAVGDPWLRGSSARAPAAASAAYRRGMSDPTSTPTTEPDIPDPDHPETQPDGTPTENPSGDAASGGAPEPPD